MEPLSPRSVNIQAKQKTRQKVPEEDEAKKVEALRKAQKEKEYAPPPPEWVIQPPVAGGALAEKFRTGKLLGKGGFAICYEGELRNKKNGSSKKNVFALKIVRSQMSQKKMEEKFRTELQIHAKMRHPNIVEFYRAFTFRESTYVVLELCSNGSVMEMVKKRRCLSLPEVRRFTVQLCGAIKYMHARNVIHRDLKMGNLFLDHEMNIKIGDFGLAAVLVSKDEVQGLFDSAKHRRTTLCGTPNYIAPEILEKGKGGHDHKVDIWAIGVIVFAMLAGQPPFQSSSQSEIYRRAKSVEYAWPDVGKSTNDIPPEAKDLVSRLLKVEAAERPGPDEVIGHSFFSMHGGNGLPAMMDSSQRYEVPQFLDGCASPRGDVMREDAKRLSLRHLAKHCGVGVLPGDSKPQPAVGADISLSLYMECFAEEQSGSSPIVPLPHDFVYASKFPSGVWPSLQESISEEPVPVAEKPVELDLAQDQPPIQGAKPRATERPRRALVQSHAATLRAAQVAGKADRPKQVVEDSKRNRERASSGDSANSSTRRRGLITDLPMRPNSATTVASSRLNEAEQRPRATRSRKLIVLDDENVETSLEKQTPKVLTNEGLIDKACEDPDARRRDLAAKSRAKIASTVEREISKAPKKERKASNPGTAQRKSSNPTQHNTLINPDEAIENVVNSKPDAILHHLSELHQMLDASLLKSRRNSISTHDLQAVDAKSKAFKTRPVVVKWVDYTNKFGIGYILANGSVGCVFKGDATIPPTCVMVSEAESHFKKRNFSAYAEKHQIVPRRGSPVEFVENSGLDGLKRVFVQPVRYQIKVSSAGVADRLGPGFDVYDFEKRKKLCLWDKFGKYMTQTLGKQEDPESQSDSQTEMSQQIGGHVAGPFVKFYQRLGNVGIWGFGDGSFQFNFPDHTKLVVSDDGSWLDFYHLPASAAQTLKAGGSLNPGALAERGVISYPTDVLLNGSFGGQNFREITCENELRRKVEFVKDVVAIWAREGGLGVMGANRGVKWNGVTEKGGKLVWVTVGAHGGDGRYEIPTPGV